MYGATIITKHGHPVAALVPVTEHVAGGRQQTLLELADAVQAVSALAVNAAALVTHDRDFSRVRALRIIS